MFCDKYLDRLIEIKSLRSTLSQIEQERRKSSLEFVTILDNYILEA